MSYTIDIYKNKLRPTDSIINFATFVSYFPQLVAGPIERASSLLPQIESKKKFDYLLAKKATHKIIYGLFKKIVVADNLALIIDNYHSNPYLYSSNSVFTFVVIIFYSFQIYCDFSGYSDIAIGVSRLFGIKLNNNFIRPYFSSSFKQFWTRWHISLSTWLRDYLYIGLFGGNRSGVFKTARNLILTMTIGGLWHGSSYNFVLWGLIHGIVLVIEKKIIDKNYYLIFNRLFIFAIVSLTWIPFRSADFSITMLMIDSIINFKIYSLPISIFLLAKCLFCISLLLYYDYTLELKKFNESLSSMIFMVNLIFLFGNFENNNFIYFQF